MCELFASFSEQGIKVRLVKVKKATERFSLRKQWNRQANARQREDKEEERCSKRLIKN